MSNATPNSVTCWKWSFLVLETVVLVTFVSCVIVESIWGLRVEPESEAVATVLGIVFMLAWLFLLIVSPFFLKALRWVALAGWIIAMGILVISALTQFYEVDPLNISI